jgi:amino acid transporter
MTTVEGESRVTAPSKMTLPTLTAMVVGSMVGAGVFSLPTRFATATGVAGAIIAWIVAGTGMLMLAFVFQTLAIRKPELDSGIPYLLSAAYALKIAITRETYEAGDRARTKELVIGLVAVIYTLFLLFVAGPKFLLFSCIILAPGTVLYLIARRENSLRAFRPWEPALCGVIILGAIIGVIALATGGISI